MNGTKSWTESLGVWGGVIAMVVPAIGAALHMNITPGDVQSAIDLATQIIGGIGGLIAIYGRVTATKTIG